MPALYTHYKFGQDVLNNLNIDIQNTIKENISYYNIFNQGFDNLYYHYKWTYYRNFGVNAHKHNIDKFFYNIFTFIKNNNLENDSKLTNMIYGFINHYTIDTIIHPFINYQVKNLNIPHTKIEFMIDYYLSTENNQKWHNKNYKILIPKLKFDNNLKNLINDVFYKTYQEENIGKVFSQSHNNGYYIYRYFINDLSGIKTFFYKIVDKLFPKKDILLSKNTFTKNIDLRIFNNDKLKWHNPKNNREIYDYSFDELYNYALNICSYLCHEAYKVLNDESNINDFINLINQISLKNIQKFPLQ